jgi:gliding motility-associated-like protein
VHPDAAISICDNMKKNIFNLLLLFLFEPLIAQNLIPNPNFDSIILCPNSLQVTGGGTPINLFIPPWTTATELGTPDVFNQCSSTPYRGVPFNGVSSNKPAFQPALSGSGYSGISPYFITSKNNPDLREYIETPLVEPLKRGMNYFVQFYVSPRNIPDLDYDYIDAIGLKFTDTFLFQKKLQIITEPSISNRKRKILKDTIGWTPVMGCYKARGGEQYATIGNFINDNEVNYESDIPQNRVLSAYLYLEDVSVIPFNPLPDTILLCENKSISLTTPRFRDVNYLWNTGSKDTVITVSKAGTYKVEIALDNCTLSDSVVVIMPKASDKPLKDTAICKGQTITLNPQTTGKYQWSNGSKNAQISVNTEGSYSVTVSNVCGDFTYNSTVKLKKCDCNIFVPNAFSPNNDGVNDELQAFINCDIPIKVKRFQVFNRWGNLLFTQSNTNDIRWNGQVNGTQLDQGTFVWYMEYEIEKDGKMETKIEYGDFTIIL